MLLMASVALFPPREYFGREDVFRSRGFLFRRELTQKPSSIDLEKLAVEWMFLGALTGAFVCMAKGKFQSEEKTG
ncbi:MAG: hypothetical protein ACYTER_10135 [Planctomycetota bacterium]